MSFEGKISGSLAPQGAKVGNLSGSIGAVVPDIRDESVTTAKLADAAVTIAKLAQDVTALINSKGSASDVAQLQEDVAALQTITEGLGTASTYGVANNLTQAAAGANVLDAYQGKVLKDWQDRTYVSLGTITASSNMDAVIAAFNALQVTEHTCIGTFNRSGMWMFMAYKYTGGQYGMMIAVQYYPNITTRLILQRNNGVDTVNAISDDVEDVTSRLTVSAGWNVQARKCGKLVTLVFYTDNDLTTYNSYTTVCTLPSDLRPTMFVRFAAYDNKATTANCMVIGTVNNANGNMNVWTYYANTRPAGCVEFLVN